MNLLGMVKQDCHNPFVTKILHKCGSRASPLSSPHRAHRLHRYGFPAGQVGHLSQVSLREAAEIVAMNLAIKYLGYFARKYSPAETISDTPKNRAMLLPLELIGGIAGTDVTWGAHATNRRS